MTGAYHKLHNIPFGILTVLSLIVFFGFKPYFIFSIPFIWYFATFPDIDQSTYAPKETKRIKAMFTVITFLAPIAAVALIGQCGANLFRNVGNKQNNLMGIGISVIILLVYAVLYKFRTTKQGAFLWAHRGFTHTLIMPVGFSLLLLQLMKVQSSFEGYMKWVGLGGQVLLLGIILGMIGHIWLDAQCKAGVPLFWPIPIIGVNKKGMPRKIHFWNAITSDSRQPDGVHISSKITTYVWCTIYFCLILYLIYAQKETLFGLLKF